MQLTFRPRKYQPLCITKRNLYAKKTPDSKNEYARVKYTRILTKGDDRRKGKTPDSIYE